MVLRNARGFRTPPSSAGTSVPASREAFRTRVRGIQAMSIMSTKRFIRLGAALGVLLMASAALAQNAGSMRGTVTDSSGAVVPGASVTLTNDATKFARRAVSDSKGGYFFASVEPGAYTLTVEIQGFKTREVKGIRMNP